ncbi:LysM peptidoglycan-binding domain-containing protein [Leptolyngbya sp. 7M]|uniref:LysM peptidoglycan-binding domain-containing protein n=1 Tax=Leptolyngbya sp. 7M TaxID=2812896 RepID=UPI001B8CD1FE|nr:LysM peptidoglycan-binding domain-containing protein [Leptolyngbya sp. 7M]QYO67299.1 LysM peptidoglycan-binding domain-containing protein [Leptolyngbya sp. 7M]
MNNRKKTTTVLLLAATFAFGLVLEAAGQRPTIRRATTSKNAASGQYTVPAGKKIRVRIDQNLNSKVSKVGDTFTTTTLNPVYSATGQIIIPQGSEIIGRVDRVSPAVKGGKVGEIDVSFRQLVLPNGTKRTINGSLTDLSEDDAKSDNEGTARGDRMQHRKVIFIGGGGAGGAILGGAIGGGKGALIGGIIGAGAGLLGERLTKGEEAEVKSGAEFGIYLNQPVTLPRYAAVEEADDQIPPYDGPVGSGRTYVVQPGDTLGIISRKVYGTSARYMEIYNANRDKLASPNSVTAGQVLVIP